MNDEKYFSIFLAGSIEQDTAAAWQKQVVKKFSAYPNVVLYNPRRDEWDASWETKADSENFRQQVEWELYHLERADLTIMYFDPSTKSPISLLELGLFGRQQFGYYDKDGASVSRIQVVCPEPFWRKGNVDIVCQRYGINQHETLTDAINSIKKRFRLRSASKLK